MKCTKCGSEIPSQSKFCLSCGQPLAPATAAPAVRAAAAGPSKTTKIMAIVAGLIVVLAIGLFAHGRAVTQASRSTNGNGSPVVKAPMPAGGPQADLLKTNVKNPPLNLNAPAKTPPPQEVLDYLAHLKKVDDARQDLQRREIASMLGMMTKAQASNLEQWLKADDPDAKMDEASSSTEAKKLTADMNAEWQKLCQLFLSVPAPQPCAALSGQYYDALRGVLGAFQQVNEKVANLDVSALYLMQGQTSKVDEKFTKSDTELANVCSKYGIDKGFSITTDGGMPALTGLPTPK
jgi:flagellar biosynthesis/type III secretory pathway chaperone